MVISAAFLALNKLAVRIAHAPLRQLAIAILSDAAEFAKLMLDNDLSNPEVAAAVFAAQQPVARPLSVVVETVAENPPGIVPMMGDVPKTVRRKKATDSQADLYD